MNEQMTRLMRMNQNANNNMNTNMEPFDIKSKRISILETYGENFNEKEFITNPAIGRERELKELMLTLLTPDKSAILSGPPGVGKN